MSRVKVPVWVRAGLMWGVASGAFAQTPQGSAFTYQGRLSDNGTAATGAYDLRFALFDAAASGTQVGATTTLDDVSVSAGLFTVSLDFGSAAFAGDARWLEVGARAGASTGAFTPVGPRQRLTPAPSAVFAAGTSWAGILGKPAGFADDIDNDSGGDITAVSAGTGLTGGATTGPATLAVSFGGTGAAATVSRSDHNHNALYAPTTHDHFGESWTGAGSPGLDVRGTAFIGLRGETSSTTGSGRGVYGVATSTGILSTYGVVGEISSRGGAGVKGEAFSTLGLALGLHGLSASTNGRGVLGQATSTVGTAHGVAGESASPDGRGVSGENEGTSGDAVGVFGLSASSVGRALYGRGNSSFGANYGVYGETRSNEGRGVFGLAASTLTGQPAIGVEGRANAVTGIGVKGVAAATAGTGVHGEAPAAGFAGFFQGRVHVTGLLSTGTNASIGNNLTVGGSLSKGSGTFKIDHPLDPENKYLYHSFVESPDMMNIYNGTVRTDASGYATVELPDWMEALNRDFRYQLTVIDTDDQDVFVQAKVVRTVEKGRFVLRTSAPDVQVSWQVTGIRRDAYAEAHRVQVEVDKPEDERGTYLHPAEWGQPASKGLAARQR